MSEGCKDFEKERCTRLEQAPYVCNGCSNKISHCTISRKYTYKAKFADRKYRELISDSRSGIPITKHELRQKDQIVTPLIQQGQSPYQITDCSAFVDRTYLDFQSLGLNSFVEMDTMHSSYESKNAADILFYRAEAVSCISDESLPQRLCKTCI